jgi:hypothetical protein
LLPLLLCLFPVLGRSIMLSPFERAIMRENGTCLPYSDQRAQNFGCLTAATGGYVWIYCRDFPEVCYLSVRGDKQGIRPRAETQLIDASHHISEGHVLVRHKWSIRSKLSVSDSTGGYV